MSGRKPDEKKLSQNVVLQCNSDWRCGELERSIILYLQKKKWLFKTNISLKEVVSTLSASHSRDECLDAIKRLEQRQIVMLLPTK